MPDRTLNNSSSTASESLQKLLHLNFFSYCQFPDFEKFACRIPIKRTKLDFHFEFHSKFKVEDFEKKEALEIFNPFVDVSAESITTAPSITEVRFNKL